MVVKNKTILAVGAHPDDIEYWAGGTMLKLGKENRLVYVIATDGGIGGGSLGRRREQKQAAKLVGVRKLIFLDYPDSELETKSLDLQRDLLEVVLRVEPDVVFSFDLENQFRFQPDVHPDHRTLSMVTADLVLIYSTLPAYIKRMNLKLRPLEYKPEVWLFNPKTHNYFEDISSVWDEKLKLLKIFESQNLDLQTAAFEAERLGQLAGVKYAEGFNRVDFYSETKRMRGSRRLFDKKQDIV